MTTRQGWYLVLVLWAIVSGALLQTTQGTYEDHQQIAAATQGPPTFLSARGLTKWTIWAQVRTGVMEPWQFRAVNSILALGVGLLSGLLATRLGLSGWLSAGIVLVHPLAIEAVASLSGRGDLLATLALLVACLCAMSSNRWVWLGIVPCLGLGWLAKESVIVGVAIVPALWRVTHPGPKTRWAFISGLAVLVVGSGVMRMIGTSAITRLETQTHWSLRQSGAAFRLIELAVWPHGQTVDYDYDSLTRLWCVLAALSLLAVLWMTGQLWRWHRVGAFSLTAVLMVVLPRIIVQTPKSYLNEHQFYSALPFVALGLSSLIAAWPLAWVTVDRWIGSHYGSRVVA